MTKVVGIATAALVAIVMALVVGRGAAHAQALGFEHEAHARAVAQRGDGKAAAIGCVRCHATSAGVLGKRPDHATCFGECHGAAPTRKEALQLFPTTPRPTPNPIQNPNPNPTPNPIQNPNPIPNPNPNPNPIPTTTAAAADGDEALVLRARTCTACHRADDLTARRFAVSFPPYRVELDFSATTLSHAKHHRQAECLQCHSVPAAAAASPAAPPRAAQVNAGSSKNAHRRCLSCHTGKAQPGAFAMEQCESCHRPVVDAARPASLITVTAAFSHPSHQRYAERAEKAAGKAAPAGATACLACHRALAEEEAPAHPRPAAATCATAACHDGKAAFGLTEKCTQCHREEPKAFYPVPRPTQRFDHRQHKDTVAAVGCQGCHRIAAGTGAAAAVAGADHAACASCHAEDFGAAKPVTCGACHSSTEPWRHLRADRLPPDDTEFGARLDHAKHPQPCERCHVLDTATRQLRPPRDHSACTGAGCHQLTGGVAPKLSACADCHRQDLVADRDERRARAQWSVRHRFDHNRHRLAKDGSPAACTSCHTALSGELSAMPTPAKRTCEPCHDGKTAFSVTGVSCNRCHGGVR